MSNTRTRIRGPGMTGTVAAMAASLLLGAATAQAQTVERVGSTITAIRGLQFQGTTYDVEFLLANTFAVYDIPPVFDFPDVNDAQAATQAVVDVINAEGDIFSAGPGATPIFRVGFDIEAIPIPIVDIVVEVTLIWEGVTGDVSSPGVWGAVPESDQFPSLDDGTFAKFYVVDSGGGPPPGSEPDARFVDEVTLGDVGGSSDADLAVLDVELADGRQLSATVHVRDGGTGNEIYQTTLKNDWNSLAIETLVGNSGPLLTVLQQKSDGTIRVHVLEADDGTVKTNYQYFEPDWTPIDILSVSDAGGAGIPGIAVLAKQPNGQIAIQTRKAGNGNIVETVFYFSGALWNATEAIDLGDFNGNGRSEIAVLATKTNGDHAVETRDALSGAQISRNFFLGPAAVTVGLADVADVDGNSRPEIAVLGNKSNDPANPVQTKDVKTGLLITKVGTYGPVWRGLGLRSIGDVDGNSAEEVVLLAFNGDNNKSSVQVRDVAAGTLTKKFGVLGSAYDPRDFEVLDDVSGNSIEEVVVAGLKPGDLAVRIQLRDAFEGTLIRNIDIN